MISYVDTLNNKETFVLDAIISFNYM